MITVDNKYEIGETVYLKTDTQQLPRLVFAFEVTKECCLYKLCQGTFISSHYDFEIVIEKYV